MLTLHYQYEFSLLIIYWGEWEVSHTCQSFCLNRLCKLRLEPDHGTLFTNFPLAVWAFWIIIFLLPFLLRVISSFTLNLLLFCEISELWGMNACILSLRDWGGRTASWELELPTRRISVLKALNSRALFPIAKQKIKSSKPSNIHPWRKMNNISLILYKGERRFNESCGLGFFFFFFFTLWTPKWWRELDYRFLGSLISWLIYWTPWISLPKSLNFLFTQPSHFTETILTLQPDHR